MSRRISLSALSLCCALGISAGCREKPEPPTNGGRAPAPLKLTLPPGWSAQSTSEQTLRAGPKGRPVLEIRSLPGEAKNLPDPETLERQFAAEVQVADVRVIRREAQPDLSLVGLELRARGSGKSSLAFLGAKTIEDDLYLCRSLPGSTEEELQGAVSACKTIARSSVPATSSGDAKP
jgi:hypothetical protein